METWRHFYDAEIKKVISAEGNEVIEVFTGAYKQIPSKIVYTLYSLQKWSERNLEVRMGTWIKH